MTFHVWAQPAAMMVDQCKRRGTQAASVIKVCSSWSTTISQECCYIRICYRWHPVRGLEELNSSTVKHTELFSPSLTHGLTDLWGHNIDLLLTPSWDYYFPDPYLKMRMDSFLCMCVRKHTHMHKHKRELFLFKVSLSSGLSDHRTKELRVKGTLFSSAFILSASYSLSEPWKLNLIRSVPHHTSATIPPSVLIH